jgi:hypothetical protein
VNPSTPPFAAEYTAEPLDPTRPASDDTFTIRPRRRSCMPGRIACVHAITPTRFTASTRCQSASSVSVNQAHSS